MSSSTNFSSKEILALGLALLLLAGCAVRERPPYPPLTLQALTVDRPGPQQTHLATVRWVAEATGGAGGLTYTFMIKTAGKELIEQQGAAPTWKWTPEKPGAYRIKALVTDNAGNRVESGWTPAYVIVPPVTTASRFAMLPIENLSDTPAPLPEIAAALKGALGRRGVSLLEEEQLAEFMRRYRIRYTGGIGSHSARAIKEEAGVEAVLITSLEAYQEANPPKISLISRLVLSGDKPAVLWTETVGLTGIDSHGLLGLSRIKDRQVLLGKAVEQVAGSLASYLSAQPTGVAAAGDPLPPQAEAAATENYKRKYKPKHFYRASGFEAGRRYKIAVVPFLNLSQRKDAGKIVTLHFLEQLNRRVPVTTIEPGLVREELLRYRTVMSAGPSLADADLITDKSSLDADLVLSGKVFDFQSVTGIPKVDFSVHVIEKKSREVVWESRSYNHGEEGVYFFDFGRVHAARELTAEMTRAVLGLFLQ